MGSNVTVIDAGGGTVDISTYKFTGDSPVEIEEIVAPGCKCGLSSLASSPAECTVPPGIFEGSVMIRQRAEEYLRGSFHHSKQLRFYRADHAFQLD